PSLELFDMQYLALMSCMILLMISASICAQPITPAQPIPSPMHAPPMQNGTNGTLNAVEHMEQNENSNMPGNAPAVPMKREIGGMDKTGVQEDNGMMMNNAKRND
ncbi:hypothetical protein PENTCL1PPCAC_30214, partial [Pristionchus entomophagus]